MSGNLVVSGGLDGIDISADNVVLDLNGFSISGTAGGNGVSSPNNSVTVQNGSLVGFNTSANLRGAGGPVEKVHASLVTQLSLIPMILAEISPIP